MQGNEYVFDYYYYYACVVWTGLLTSLNILQLGI
jgi:hypothetical protein